MSKILITNEAIWNNRLRELFDSAGFCPSASYCWGGVDFTAYKKLSNETHNFFMNDENDFVISTGTMFYKGQFGDDALSMLLADGKVSDVKALRSNMIGSYAVAIKIGDQLRVFVDETHTYDLCYHIDQEGKFLITNTFYHVKKCIHSSLAPNVVLERGVRGGIIGLMTPFNEIKTLGAREVIQIDLVSQKAMVKQCDLNDYRCVFSSIDEGIEEIWKRAQQIAALRVKHLRRSLYFVTGGVDSRIELAAAIHNNEEITLGYWMGSDSITNGTISDLAIQRKIAEEKGLQHRCYDVSVSFEDALSGITTDFCDRYGEYASIYCGNKKWFKIFEDLKDVDYVGFGFFGETIRSVESIDLEIDQTSTLLDYVRKVYCRTHIEDLVSSPTFYDEMCARAAALLGSDQDFDSKTPVNQDVCARLFGYSRFSADCTLSNFVNLFTYSFPLLGTKSVADAVFSLLYDWKQNDRVAIGLISRWDGELLELPFFSHHHRYAYDSAEKKLVPEESFNFRSRLKKIGVLRNIYRRFLRGHMGGQAGEWSALYKACVLQLNDLSSTVAAAGLSVNSEEPKEIELATLATFVAQLKVLDRLVG